MPSEMDYARLAAYIDGEGCIQLSKNCNGGRSHQVTITLSNTDFRLPIWCRENFGGFLHRETKDSHQNFDKLGWHIGAEKAAQILRHCLPYFVIKREEAEVVLEFQSTKKYHRWNPIPQEIKEKRIELVQRLKTLKNTRPKIDMPLKEAV